MATDETTTTPAAEPQAETRPNPHGLTPAEAAVCGRLLRRGEIQRDGDWAGQRRFISSRTKNR